MKFFLECEDVGCSGFIFLPVGATKSDDSLLDPGILSLGKPEDEMSDSVAKNFGKVLI
jgi:hypothetical protein